MRTPFLHQASSFEELWSEVDFATMEIPERFNLGVACVDDQDPDARALTVVAKDESSVSYTFGEIKERSNRLANGLAGLGVKPGEVVAIVNPASLETAVAFMAIFRMGAVALPMSSLFGPDALRYRLSNSEARAVITSTANAAKVREGHAGRTGVDVIVIGEPGPGERGFDELLAASSPGFEPVDTGAE